MSCSLAGRLLAAALCALVVLTVACGGGGDGGAERDPQDFSKFLDKLASAAKEADVEFFTSRVPGKPYTCTELDASTTPVPGGPELPLCLTAGEQFQSVFLAGYPFGRALTTTERLSTDLQAFFREAQPDEEDGYGPGGVRLFAAAVSEQEGQPRYDVALITALHPSRGLTAEPLARAVRALYFERAGERWVIAGEIAAGPPLAVDLLDAQLVPKTILQNWQRYE